MVTKRISIKIRPNSQKSYTSIILCSSEISFFKYICIFIKQMKIAQLFMRSLPRLTQSIYSKPSRSYFAAAFTGFGLSLAAWMTTTKVFSEELTVLETDDDLREGQVRELLVGPKPQDTILVINYQGSIYSVQSKCSHFGFSLAKGVLLGNQILCPLHNAGFSIQTGQSNQGPTFNGLKVFPVQRVDGKIRVSIPKLGWDSAPEYHVLGKENINKNQKIVIVGAGPAALSAAETLRNTGYKGYIYLVTKEKELPYDRTMLSKVMDQEKAPKPIRRQEQLQNNGIIVLKDSTVTGIDYSNKSISIADKNSITYDKLLIASGMRNKIPNILGLNKVKFYTLRNKQDYANINAALRDPNIRNVTIIGAGFIGMQVGSAIKMGLKDKNVTVITDQKIPMQNIFGDKIGSVLANLSKKNGVNIITNAKVNGIEGEGKVTGVQLEEQNIATDVLIISTGVQAAIQFAHQLEKDEGGLKTNIFLQTSQKDVYAAGDIASYPYWYTGTQTRIQHYNEAIYQGSVAALNMMGKKFPIDNIPFFWTRQFNNSLVFTGVTKGWDDIHIVGSLQEMKFTVYYIRKSDDKVLGAACMNSLNNIQLINQAMQTGVMPNGVVIKSPNFILQDLMKEIKKKDPQCRKCTMCQ